MNNQNIVDAKSKSQMITMLQSTQFDHTQFGGVVLTSSSQKELGHVSQSAIARESDTDEQIGVVLVFEMDLKISEARVFTKKFSKSASNVVDVMVIHDNFIPKVICLCPPNHIKVVNPNVAYCEMSSVN